MVVTPVGASFVRRANVILTEVLHAREEVDQLHGGTSGTMTATLSSVPHITLLPRAIRPFRSRYPDVRLQLIEGRIRHWSGPQRWKHRFFFVKPAARICLAARTASRAVLRQSTHRSLPQGASFSKARSLRDLAAAEWVVPAFTRRFEEEFNEVFATNGVPPPRIAASAQSALTMLVLLMHSDMLTLMPLVWLSFEPISKVLIPIAVREQFPAPPVVAVRRSGLPLAPAAEFLLDLLRRGVSRPQPPRGFPASPK